MTGSFFLVSFLLRLLEVGAVRPDNYRGCASWMDVTAIDLHSRHPSILEQDFLLMDLSEHRETWDVVSLSLVLNFVPDGKDRGTLRLIIPALSPLIPLFRCCRLTANQLQLQRRLMRLLPTSRAHVDSRPLDAS